MPRARWFDAAGRRIDPAAVPGDTRAAIRRAVELALPPVRSRRAQSEAGPR